MAYSGKQSFTGAYAIRDLWTYLIRFVVDSGYWSIVASESQPGGTDTYNISQDITVTALDTWLDLTSADAYDDVVTTNITGETLATGDGTTTHFEYTCAHIPVKNLTIHYTIGGTSYTATDDTSGNITGTDCSGTIDYTTGAISLDFTTAPDNTTNITVDYIYTLSNTDYEIDINLGRIKFLSTGSIQLNDTVHIDYNWKRAYIILYSTGLSGNEKIYIGIFPYIDPDGIHGCLVFKAYKYWQEGMIFTDTSLGCPYNDFRLALWNSDTDLWLFVNKQRIIAVSCIQTVYSSAYLGFFNRFAMPHEYNYPLCVITSDDTGMNYDSTSGDRQFIINGRRLNFMQEQNLWKDWHSGNPGVLLPIQRDTGNLVQIHYPADAPRCLMPVYIYADGNIYGQLDDVYFIPGAINTSESEITVGGDTYICFENVFRHGWADFMAIKEA